jgi:hypothetical protein
MDDTPTRLEHEPPGGLSCLQQRYTVRASRQRMQRNQELLRNDSYGYTRDYLTQLATQNATRLKIPTNHIP